MNAVAASATERLAQWRARVERVLESRLPAVTAVPVRLHEAIRYSVLGAGKRVRPALVYAAAETVGLPLERVDGAACAVELIHAYSLVHDDLPAMDDDDLRRGRPTCHKAYDEATAILVGDALQVLAFRILARDKALPDDPAVRLRIIDLLADAAGTAGMAGGQALDLAAAGRSLSVAAIEDIHRRKTGALIRASVLMGAACQPTLAPEKFSALERFGDHIGLAFQIQDDLLDVEGDAALMGKATGADEALDKPTHPAIAGVAQSRSRVAELHRRALADLHEFAVPGTPLEFVANWLLERRH